jgi:Ca2+/Na+ antiporter
MPLFRYLSATMSIERDERERESLFYFCVFVAPTCERRRVVAVQKIPFFWGGGVAMATWLWCVCYVSCHQQIRNEEKQTKTKRWRVNSEPGRGGASFFNLWSNVNANAMSFFLLDQIKVKINWYSLRISFFKTTTTTTTTFSTDLSFFFALMSLCLLCSLCLRGGIILFRYRKVDRTRERSAFAAYIFYRRYDYQFYLFIYSTR